MASAVPVMKRPWAVVLASDALVVLVRTPVVALFVSDDDALSVCVFVVVALVVDALRVRKLPVVPQRVWMVAVRRVSAEA